LTNELVVAVLFPEIETGLEVFEAVHDLVFDARREDLVETEDVGRVQSLNVDIGAERGRNPIQEVRDSVVEVSMVVVPVGLFYTVVVVDVTSPVGIVLHYQIW
jgi:hypothetical protein